MASSSLNESINLDEDDEIDITKHDQEAAKRPKEFSDVWKYFIKKDISQDGIKRAECKGCKTEYKCGGKQYGTSTLRRHLLKCKLLRFHDVGQMIVDYDGKIRAKKIDQRISRDLLSAAVIKHDLPFSFVEYDAIRTWAKLYMLFEHYSNANKTSSSLPRSSSSITLTPIQSGAGVRSKGKRIFDEIKAYESQSITNAGKSQLDLYLEEPKLEFAYYEDLDVLEYWMKHKKQNPTLALMACDILAIPITNVASESAFSIDARVLTKYKSSTFPEKVQALSCTRNWLHDYNVHEDSASIKMTFSN